MDIKNLPMNDKLSQCIRKLEKQPEEYVKARKEEINNCNHLFVKLKEGKTTSGFHSTDYYHDPSEVECVHCGLTNKYQPIENSDTFKNVMLLGCGYNYKTIESEMFSEIFKNAWYRGGKSFNDSVFNLISEEVLPTYHPSLLYKLAIENNPEASSEEIFEIMKELHSLETRQESLRLQTVEQAQELMSRYKSSKGKSKSYAKTR